MKKVFTFLVPIVIGILLTAGVFLPQQASAQSPEKMSYQAVIRNSSNALVTDAQIGVQISILQGTVNGVAVYVETQSPTTNANGLVSVEIGAGTFVSGDFSTINWANGPYFIKTETDPAGGTSYTITGTSQLLSVPYALHAKTAETVTGSITEADPVYTGSEAANITDTYITNLSNLSGTNTGDQDLSGLATTNDLTTDLDLKVDKVLGKGLSTNNYSNAEKNKLAAISGTNTGDQDLSTLATKIALGDSTALVRSEIPDVSGFLSTETDPEFNLWDRSTGISITESQVSDLDHFTTADETDPVFTVSQAANITATDMTNLGNLSGVNTGDQDLSPLATKIALGDSTALVRSEIPDVSGFLSTETDPEFNLWDRSTGISITESQVSDLDHFTTADETDPVFTGSQAANITATDMTNLGNLSGTNTGDQDLSTLATKIALGDSISQIRTEIPPATDGSETKITAGSNVNITGSGTTASPYVVGATGGTTLNIGDSYQGGIIFWLDATGQHGLIAATADQSTGIAWNNGTMRYTGTTGDGLYAGKMNTAMIVATQMADNESGNFAAKVCADYSATEGSVTYGDWYLPSKYELNLLYMEKTAVGGFASTEYWSSTEMDLFFAWLQYFGAGYQFDDIKDSPRSVRAIRAF